MYTYFYMRYGAHTLAIPSNPDLVFENTTTIHERESEIDRTYRQFLEFIYSNIEDIRILLRVRDSIVLLEQMADRVHDIADVMRVLLYQ